MADFETRSETVIEVPDVDFPLYFTQGGGLAQPAGDMLVWYSDIPGFLAAQVGDPILPMWDYLPANEAAREEVLDEQFLS